MNPQTIILPASYPAPLPEPDFFTAEGHGLWFPAPDKRPVSLAPFGEPNRSIHDADYIDMPDPVVCSRAMKGGA